MSQEYAATSFTKVIAAVAVLLLLAISVAGVLEIFQPPAAHAQNAGTVGIQAKAVSVFTNLNTSGTTHSSIFQDIGQGVNILFYCTTTFNGTINLEWNPPGSGTTYFQLALADYTTLTDSNCHTLTINGYFPNLRSTVVRTGGSVSAWYTSSSGPTGFAAPALGSNGVTSPIQCDQFSNSNPGGSATPGVLTGQFVNGKTSFICGFTVTFVAAPSAGTFSIGFSTTSGCAAIQGWTIATTASTPLMIIVPISIHSPSPQQAIGCYLNNTGTQAYINYNYATVQAN